MILVATQQSLCCCDDTCGLYWGEVGIGIENLRLASRLIITLDPIGRVATSTHSRREQCVLSAELPHPDPHKYPALACDLCPPILSDDMSRLVTIS